MELGIFKDLTFSFAKIAPDYITLLLNIKIAL